MGRKWAVVEAFKMDLHLPDLNQIYIPKRRRSSPAEKKQRLSDFPMSMSEAADVLIQISHSVSYVKPEKINKPPPVTEKQRKKKKKAKQIPLIREMPAAIRDRIVEMGGYGINLVIQKELQDTDVNKNQGRLLLPANKLLFDFATEEERELLSQHENKNKKGMDVMIIMDDDVVEERRICLKKWRNGSGDVYCLLTQWNAFVEETGLKSGQHIQLWCFRKDYEFECFRLCFAMVKLN